jgi:hypothetical protein
MAAALRRLLRGQLIDTDDPRISAVLHEELCSFTVATRRRDPPTQQPMLPAGPS